MTENQLETADVDPVPSGVFPNDVVLKEALRQIETLENANADLKARLDSLPNSLPRPFLAIFVFGSVAILFGAALSQADTFPMAMAILFAFIGYLYLIYKIGRSCSIKRAENKFAEQKKVFKTIKLGTPALRGADDFRRILNQAGHRIGDWANDILGRRAFTAATEETEVDLVVVSVAELGFLNGATRQDIYHRAQELGLMLCPAEVGPQLRLQYPDQPLDEWLLIGMEPITDSDGDLRVFYVGRGYFCGSWLDGRCGDPGFVWRGDNRWVFLRRPSTRA